jgi:hypothetical protein
MNTNEQISVLSRSYIYARTYPVACHILPKGKPVRAFEGKSKSVDIIWNLNQKK